MAKYSPELDIAMTVLVDADEYLLQKRPLVTKKGASGLIGCFGGQIEAGEEPVAAAVRELVQEAGLIFDESQLSLLGEVHVISDRNNREVLINASVFEVLLPHGFPVTAIEGELKRMRLGEISKATAKGRITPATAKAFSKFYGA